MKTRISLVRTAHAQCLVLVIVLVGVNSALESWPGVWSCLNNRCVYSALSESGNKERTWTPLNNASHSLCRLNCGPYGSLWPRPTGQLHIGAEVVPVHAGRIHVDVSRIAAAATGRSLDPLGVTARVILDVAVQAFRSTVARLCDPLCEHSGNTLVVEVECNSTSTAFTWDTDESYKINVFTNGDVVTTHIHAPTVWGARHAFETLSQLVATTAVNEGSARSTKILAMVRTARVTDAPKYPHRGLLLDTARHFLPLSALLRTVDAMASVKLNVLHWHATDSHSFPLVFPSAPHMARLGAYSAQEVYTPAAVAHLLRYARLRGVRVILEIDTPAHCAAGWTWGPEAGMGDLVLCAAKQPWRQFCLQPPCGQLNPVNPAVVDVLRLLYRDAIATWPADSPLHMGGDEVSLPCWNSSAEVIAALKSQKRDRSAASFVGLWGAFQKSALNALDSEASRAGKRPPDVILWSSHLTQPPYLQKFLPASRYIIQAWSKSQDKLPQELVSLGYRVILSFWNSWYLDHGWRQSTVYHPWGYIRDQKLPSSRGSKGRVLGGEVALWGELVDAAALDGKLWPRAAAVAERLWSEPSEPWTAVGVSARFAAARSRLERLGIKPEPVEPQWCELREDECS